MDYRFSLIEAVWHHLLSLPLRLALSAHVQGGFQGRARDELCDEHACALRAHDAAAARPQARRLLRADHSHSVRGARADASASSSRPTRPSLGAALRRANAPSRVITVSSGGMLTEALHVREFHSRGRDTAREQAKLGQRGSLRRLQQCGHLSFLRISEVYVYWLCLERKFITNFSLVQTDDMEWAEGGFSGTRQYARDKCALTEPTPVLAKLFCSAANPPYVVSVPRALSSTRLVILCSHPSLRCSLRPSGGGRWRTRSGGRTSRRTRGSLSSACTRVRACITRVGSGGLRRPYWQEEERGWRMSTPQRRFIVVCDRSPVLPLIIPSAASSACLSVGGIVRLGWDGGAQEGDDQLLRVYQGQAADGRAGGGYRRLASPFFPHSRPRGPSLLSRSSQTDCRETAGCVYVLLGSI